MDENQIPDVEERHTEAGAVSVENRLRDMKPNSTAEQYLESHRWVASVHRIERTPEVERYAVSTSLQHAAGSPFQWDAISIREMYIELRPLYKQLPEKNETVLHKLLRPVLHDEPFLHYIVEAKREAILDG